MRAVLIVSLVLATGIANAATPQPITRATPRAGFGTRQNSAEFSQCLLDTVRPAYPVTRVEQTKNGLLITVASAAQVAAIVAVGDYMEGNGAAVTVRSSGARQPEKDPVYKAALGCA
ncbi:hypothetical protein [Luteibacter sp. 329MFSha]|uniref:hypothetical protein n=1 Tax=Luteibacter sp. 329MFSha TaxID=1798239 RepID=UPI0008D6A9BD|nr:hypothetical protein [Luteibacter sp. 329MFSha]SEV96827.1 hypothetical protein SAMN04515660_1381 [Luteibacter sp. 329MFSha]